MAGDVIILDGGTFFYSDECGNVEAKEAEGLFYEDVRHLSQWNLVVDGKPLEELSSRRVDYYSARFVGQRGNDDAPTIVVRRDRFVTEGVHEDLAVENLTTERQRVRVELAFGSDFADVMEAQEDGNGEGRFWADKATRSVTLWNQRDGYRRGTVVSFRRQPQLTKERARWNLDLGPRESWSTCIDITPVVQSRRNPPLLRCGSFAAHAPKMQKSVQQWLDDAPEIDSDDASFERTYRQSLLDLAALRIRPDDVRINHALPGGGIPWYMAVFGRDSIVAAYQTLPFQADLAAATLVTLADLQATEWDDYRDEQPGKILHELRRGTLAATGRVPHSPYYGSHDSTLLWLILLDEYERWTGDRALVRRLEANARAAIDWMEGPADMDGDGYVEYLKRSDSDKALDNQCWRDSEGAIVFADGRSAEPPLATSDLQAYVYDARLRAARLAREFWNDEELAQRLEQRAAELKERFNRDFWNAERKHFVLALDANKQQVDALTSNLGHLLWCGIVDERRARQTARRLLQPDMFSGWGIRSMSSNDAGYNPLMYHNGTVWPHDGVIAAHGMRRYGFDDEAARVCRALLDAAAYFGYQLPEVFSGLERDDAALPVEYEDALKPQAWAAGAPLHIVRVLLGLEPNGERLRSNPHLPNRISRLRLRGVQFRGRRLDVP